jgi:predicted DNA-binding transcriptional regulator AlpA
MTPSDRNVIPFPAHRGRPARLLPLAELIDRYGFSERWWRYRIAEGMPKRKWGGRMRFDPDEVEQWMEARYGAQAG